MPNVTFAKCVMVDGKPYTTIAEAQTAILVEILTGADSWTPSKCAEKIIAERESIIAALTLTDPPRRVRPGRPKGSRNKPKTPDLPGIQPKAA